MRSLDPRAAAAKTLTLVLYHGRSLDAAEEDVHSGLSDRRDIALSRNLSYGVLRHLKVLESHGQHYLNQPFKRRDRDLWCLLLCGIYQLGWLSMPPYAAVSATVSAAAALGKAWARNRLNAILRNYQRDGCPRQGVDTNEADGASHPQWLWDQLRAAWGDQVDAIAQHNNEAGPMWLRVNRQRCSRLQYLDHLSPAGIKAEPSPWAEQGLCLDTPVPVQQLPGFEAGLVSVQDAAAQLAAPLVRARAGQRVLDACAAPGGKTAHLLELEPELELTAVDVAIERCQQIKDNLQRLQLEANVLCADAANLESWWDGIAFDRILLDTPCSASGVIRRHPDIKWLRRAQDIATLASQQSNLLTRLWTTLRPGGRLVYATCSILPAENTQIMQAFLTQQDDAQVVNIDASWGRAVMPGRQIFPGDDGMDGFYYAVVVKQE